MLHGSISMLALFLRFDLIAKCEPVTALPLGPFQHSDAVLVKAFLQAVEHGARLSFLALQIQCSIYLGQYKGLFSRRGKNLLVYEEVALPSTL